MAENTRHTPLEALLLFLCLRKDGTKIEPISFTKASETLLENEFVRESGLYDPHRLRPDALKQLYLDLLKEEVRSEIARRSSPVKEQDHNPRKRKLSTPPLRSINEAAEHFHLLQQVVDRLYVRYRDDTIRVIQDEEDQYFALRKEVEDLERPDWIPPAEKVQGSTTKARGRSSIQLLLRNDSGNVRPQENVKVRVEQQQGLEVARLPDTRPTLQPTRSGSPVRPNGVTLPENHRGPAILHSRTPSASSTRPPYSPLRESFQPLTRPPSRSHLPEHVSPYPPINHATASPTGESYRRLPHQQVPTGPPTTISPRMGQTPLKPPDRVPGSPIILPPVPGMLRSNGPPIGSLDPSADRAGPVYRPAAQHHSPRQAQVPIPSQHPNQLPQPRGYVPPGYPYTPQYVPPQYSPGPGQMSPYSPQALPHLSYPASHSGHSQSVRNQSYQPPTQHSPYPPYYGYPPDTNAYYQSHHTQTPRGPPQPPHLPYTPVVPSNTKSQPSKLSTTNTGSATKWKTKPRSVNTSKHRAFAAPKPETISPVGSAASSPDRDLGHTQNTPSQHSQRLSKASPTQNRPTGDLTRTNRPQPSTSPGSATRQPSPSLPPSYPIKSEPLGTPFASSPPPLRNQRRSTPPKRRRPPTTSTTSTPDPVSTIALPPIPTPPATHVLASRNFARTSAPIMNEITSHKFAGMFAKPLSEREAPGYKNLVYQPQNLKSIKSAISTGSRAVAAVVASGSTADDEDGGAGSSTPNQQAQSSQVWIELDSERGADVVPPKGIVNSAQLEREIMRMFANAIMFNPDEKRGFGAAWRRRAGGALGRDSPERAGGVARDARDMAEAVEKSIGVWKSAERRAGEMEEARGRPRGGVEVEGDVESVIEETVETEPAGEDMRVEGGRKRKKRKVG